MYFSLDGVGGEAGGRKGENKIREKEAWVVAWLLSMYAKGYNRSR